MLSKFSSCLYDFIEFAKFLLALISFFFLPAFPENMWCYNCIPIKKKKKKKIAFVTFCDGVGLFLKSCKIYCTSDNLYENKKDVSMLSLSRLVKQVNLG